MAAEKKRMKFENEIKKVKTELQLDVPNAMNGIECGREGYDELSCPKHRKRI